MAVITDPGHRHKEGYTDNACNVVAIHSIFCVRSLHISGSPPSACTYQTLLHGANPPPFASYGAPPAPAPAAVAPPAAPVPPVVPAAPSANQNPFGGKSLEYTGGTDANNANYSKLSAKLQEADTERRKAQEAAEARERAAEIRREERMRKIKYMTDMPDSQPAGTGRSRNL
jgi:type IV secretory pathway VirB10-like protein